MKTETIALAAIGAAAVALAIALRTPGKKVANATAQQQRDAGLSSWLDQWDAIHVGYGEQGMSKSQQQVAAKGVPLFAQLAI